MSTSKAAAAAAVGNECGLAACLGSGEEGGGPGILCLKPTTTDGLPPRWAATEITFLCSLSTHKAAHALQSRRFKWTRKGSLINGQP